MKRLALLALLSLTLTGCASLDALGPAGQPGDVYELRRPATAPVARSTQGIQLIVEQPSAGAAIDTDRILIRPSATQVQYLPDGRWSAPATVMLQTAIIETLLASNAFRFVGDRPLGVSGDIALVTYLADFGAEVVAETDGAVVSMTVVARMVREEDVQIVASRRFSRSVTVPDTSTEALIAGFESVWNGVVTDLGTWVLNVRRVPIGAS